MKASEVNFKQPFLSHKFCIILYPSDGVFELADLSHELESFSKKIFEVNLLTFLGKNLSIIRKNVSNTLKRASLTE